MILIFKVLIIIIITNVMVTGLKLFAFIVIDLKMIFF